MKKEIDEKSRGTLAKALEVYIESTEQMKLEPQTPEEEAALTEMIAGSGETVAEALKNTKESKDDYVLLMKALLDVFRKVKQPLYYEYVRRLAFALAKGPDRILREVKRLEFEERLQDALESGQGLKGLSDVLMNALGVNPEKTESMMRVRMRGNEEPASGSMDVAINGLGEQILKEMASAGKAAEKG